MKQNGRNQVLRTLSDISDETDNMIRGLAQRGWRKKAATAAIPKNFTQLMQPLDHQFITDDTIRDAAIQLEKKQRRLIRLVSARMQDLRHDIRLLTELERKLETSAAVLQNSGSDPDISPPHASRKVNHAPNSTYA